MSTSREAGESPGHTASAGVIAGVMSRIKF
jgi:hypothetical protein